MAEINECEGCDGSGIRDDAHPSCLIPGVTSFVVVVERCDTCERFPDDLSAALAIYRRAAWHMCASGGWHVLAEISARIDHKFLDMAN
jgi:hypothetical protein